MQLRPACREINNPNVRNRSVLVTLVAENKRRPIPEYYAILSLKYFPLVAETWESFFSLSLSLSLSHTHTHKAIHNEYFILKIILNANRTMILNKIISHKELYHQLW